ncbi:hypothetical protein [Nocardioides yefusunii]|uniref:Uncharacterized protein n=1 Tax=Nocardioides yefusunii TaxID=2500546 RepID=A0ABW1QRT2_9ACTN|nr:hypothetical protein [Nocardioides yefusunii]
MVRSQFRGAIVGVGTSRGVRIVVGRWHSSPLGSFADVMVETADGHRILLAPNDEVAEFVSATYSFDSIRTEDVHVDEYAVGQGAERWSVWSDSLDLHLTFGGRTALGKVLRLVPARIAESPAWCTVTDPVARVVMRGVRTRGSANEGRREWYGATDHHAVTAVSGTFDGAALGTLRPVLPSPQFGFSSTPTTPSITRVVTTVEW